MKKVYIEPLTESITIHTGMTVLTGSVYEVEVKDDDFDEEEMTPLSRKNNNLWDDENDDEEG